jgi:DNA polymerase-3 subunit delta'
MWTVVGQERALDQLISQIRSGSFHHAYLISGPSYTGKKLLAYNIAQAINCREPDAPCNHCTDCMRIRDGKHADIFLIKLNDPPDDETSKTLIGVEEIQNLQHAASLPPFEGQYKVFIIDGAESLSASAANRLLKTLEEPPPRVLFILLARMVERVIPTIASRCQHIEFKPLATETIKEYICDQYDITDQQATLISSLSRGRIGWAINAIADEGFLADYVERRNTILTLFKQTLFERFDYAERTANCYDRKRALAEEELEAWLVLLRDFIMIIFGLEDRVVNIDIIDNLRSIASQLTAAEVKDYLRVIIATTEMVRLNVNLRLALEYLVLDIKNLGVLIR